MRYPLHEFIDKKEKRYVEWLHDDKNFYEVRHKNTRKSSQVIEKRVLYIGNLVRKMEKKLETCFDIDSAIIQYFQHQEFKMLEGQKSGIRIIKSKDI